MAERRPSLRLVHSIHSVDGILLRGNSHLSEGKPEDAIKLYNKVLYDLSPGHPCALLNRALAYMWIGYHELAVADAYRAGMAATEMRNENIEHRNRRYRDVCKYIRSEMLHIQGNEDWTKSYARYVGQGWTESPLASIVINDIPNTPCEDETGRPVQALRIIPNSRVDVCAAMEVRATFRMSGALYMMGGGARAEALGLIEDGINTLYAEDWEYVELRKLGRQILEDIVSEVDDGFRNIDKSWIDWENVQPLATSVEGKREARLGIVNAAMKRRTVILKSTEYPWNPSRTESFRSWRKKLEDFVCQNTKGCSPWAVCKEDSSGNDSRPGAEIRADRDIYGGQPVLSERGFFNVVTQEPSVALNDDQNEGAYRQYCDTCGTFLVVPNDYPVLFEKYGSPSRNQPPGSSKHTSRATSIYESPTEEAKNRSPESENILSEGNEDKATPISLSAPSPPPPPLHRDTADPDTDRPDFMFCHRDHLAPTCSKDCRKARIAFDHGLCGTDIEFDLRRAHRKDWSHTTPSEQKTGMLHDLLFLRAITTAINTSTSPLSIPFIAFAGTGPNPPAIPPTGDNNLPQPENPNTTQTPSNPNPLTWSLKTHILRPLHHLTRLLNSLNQDPHSHLHLFEPYILNTLLTTIHANTTISTSSPAFTKFFNEDGLLSTSYTINQHRCWDHHITLPTGDDTAAVWTGRLEPCLSMIRIADPAKNETPNVRIVRKEGVEVFTLGDKDTVAIRAGAPLLRAAHSLIDEDANSGDHADDNGSREGNLAITGSNSPYASDVVTPIDEGSERSERSEPSEHSEPSERSERRHGNEGNRGAEGGDALLDDLCREGRGATSW